MTILATVHSRTVLYTCTDKHLRILNTYYLENNSLSQFVTYKNVNHGYNGIATWDFSMSMVKLIVFLT